MVREARHVTPSMLRIVLEGSDLADFASAAPDDHVKLFVPTDSGEVERRDYTPRRFDASARTLAIDFALHDAGPATRWAMRARPGDQLDVGGPRGSAVVPWSFDWWLLVGDETALPALGRRAEEAPGEARIISLAAVASSEEEQSFDTAADHTALWAHRPAGRADDPRPLLDALSGLSLPAGDGFVWITAEAKAARAVRDHLWGERGRPRAWTRAGGYWTKGVADAKLEG